MDKIVLIPLALTLLFVQAAPALADAASTVTVPYGAMVSDAATAVIAAVGVAIVGAFRFLPRHVQWALTVFRADQLIEKALAYARSQVDTELASKSWSVDVRSKAVAEALRYGVEHYGTLVKQIGGSDQFRQKIEARLQEWIEKAVS